MKNLNRHPEREDDEAVGAAEGAVHDPGLRAVGDAAEEAVGVVGGQHHPAEDDRVEQALLEPQDQEVGAWALGDPRVDVGEARHADGHEAATPPDHVGDPHAPLGAALEQLLQVEGPTHPREEDAVHFFARQAHELPEQEPLDPVPEPAPEHGHDGEADEDPDHGLDVDPACESGPAVAARRQEEEPDRGDRCVDGQRPAEDATGQAPSRHPGGRRLRERGVGQSFSHCLILPRPRGGGRDKLLDAMKSRDALAALVSFHLHVGARLALRTTAPSPACPSSSSSCRRTRARPCAGRRRGFSAPRAARPPAWPWPSSP